MLRSVGGTTLPAEILRSGPGDAPLTGASVPTWIALFTDAMGNRRRTDRPMLADLARVPPGPAPDLARLDPEEAVWWALHDPAFLDAAAIDMTCTGPLFPRLRDRGIEWWTQAELSGVHALSVVGLRTSDAGMLTRVERCAMWLLDEVQPDNATQWPWAVHVFAAIAIDSSRSQPVRTAARHYAQTLVHNALVNAGQPDPFAACILWSSAAWLERASLPEARGLALCAGL